MEKKQQKPVWYNEAEDLDQPASELYEGLRNDLIVVRGKTKDIERVHGFDEEFDYLDGALTCLIMAMHQSYCAGCQSRI